MSKINVKKPQTKELAKSDLSDLAAENLNVFKGVFTAWARKVPSKEDAKTIVEKFKCVCTRTLNNGDHVDITAWITGAQAEHFGISHGSTFVAQFAYDDIRLVSPKGQYNEERCLFNSRFLGVLEA